MRSFLLASLFSTVLITGCSGLKQDRTIDWSSNQLYDTAKGYMDNGTYQTAADYYTKLLARYPSGTSAQQSMLDLAYSYYKDREPDKALDTLNRFIQLYPNHAFLDYALYLKGIVEYEKNISFFDRIVPSNQTQTDPEALRRAFNSFAFLNKKFPNSEYAEDARYRMLYIRNLLAEHELNIAKYYLRTDGYVAAVNRAQSVLTNYQTSPSAPYALAVLIRGYEELGQSQLADDAMRVFKVNYDDKINDSEIEEILKGNIHARPGFWDQVTAKPRI